MTHNRNMPSQKSDCYGIHKNIVYRSCQHIPIDHIIKDGASVLQPFTQNKTNMCAGMVYHDVDLAWILIPCNHTISGVLQVCETSSTEALTFGMDIPTYQERYNLTHTYRYGNGGLELLHGDAAGDPLELQPYILGDDIKIVTMKTYITKHLSCPDKWIFIEGICFRLFTFGKRHSNWAEKAIQICHYSGFEYVSNNIKSINRLVTYLKLWLTQSTVNVYTIKSVTNNNEVTCNKYILMQSFLDEYFTMNLNHSHPCKTMDIDNLLCFHKPMNLTYLCPFGTYQCADDTCISDTSLCDTKEDCLDGDDESNCTICSLNNQKLCADKCVYPSCRCSPLYYQCSSGCVSHSMVRE